MTPTICRRLTTSLGLLFIIALPLTAWAHKASDSFIYVDQAESHLRIDLALRDLALVLPLDRNGDNRLSGAEVRSGRNAITDLVDQGLTLSNTSGLCQLAGEQWGLSRHSDGPYAAGRYRVTCPDNQPPAALKYTLLFEQDPLHRSLVSITDDHGERLAVLAPDNQELALGRMDGTLGSTVRLFGTFLYEGIIHLLIGLDHVLFLLVLMLPATLPANRPSKARGLVDQAGPERTLRIRLLELTGIVTAFTVAHSVTLALAALDIVTLPMAWVEIVIALSIAVAALNVFWPVLGRKTWKLAFGFGLIHGFGFASVLGDLTSGLSQTVIALAGFNLGVELGQLGLLLVLFPLLYSCGRFRFYERAAVPAMLLMVGALSLYWVAERATAI